MGMCSLGTRPVADVDPDPTLARLGERVRLARQNADLLQGELGRRVGLSRSSVANIEAGRQDTTVTVLARIAEALGRTVGQLVDESPAMQPAGAPWLELARRVTASERTYAQLAAQCWDSHDYLTAIRYRGLAEGLDMARNHHADVVGEREATNA
jgi:transcriptional regulator with XRE-family HTH domain